MKFLAEQLMELLSTYASILHPYNRRKAVAGLLILRSKNVLFPVSTIQFLLSLMGTEDKTLRKTIYKFIVQDMQRMNKHKRNNQINRQLLSWIHEYVRKNSDRVARKMINLCIDLYKKNIWTDAKVVNVIATGCTSQSYKIRLISSYFLISTTEMQVEESDSEDDEPDQKSKPRKGVTKMTKAKEKNIEK
jgi:protein SDA1